MKIKDRQLKILGLVVEEYVKNGQPVSSTSLIKVFKLTESPATIRNELASLEKLELIVKPHTSGGRIPTSKGYEVYVEKGKSSSTAMREVKIKLKKIFEDRTKSIDEVLDIALDLVNQTTSSMAISKKSLSKVSLQDLKAYEITKGSAMIVAVFSNGTVNDIKTDLKDINFKDFSTAIHIFADRLQGFHAQELEEAALGMKSVLSEQIKSLEDNYQDFIEQLFRKILASEYGYTGTENIVVRDGVNAETIQKLLVSIQDHSIWEMLSKSKNVKKNSTKVTVDLKKSGLQQISAVSKTFQIDGMERNIALIGTTDQAYNDIIEVLEVLDDEIKKFIK